MKVNLRNKASGAIKSQKIGWSWTCFLFSGILGIPLFLRNLNVWGALMALLWAVAIFLPNRAGSELEAIILLACLALVQLVFSFVFGITANKMAGRNYLENGWEFVDHGSTEAALARKSWGLPIYASN